MQTLEGDEGEQSCLVGVKDADSDEGHVLFVRLTFKDAHLSLPAWSIGSGSISETLWGYRQGALKM